MNRATVIRVGVLGSGLLLLATLAQATLIIDHFDFPNTGLGQQVCDPHVSFCPAGRDTNTYTTTNSAQEIIGGSRFVQVHRMAGASFLSGTAGGAGATASLFTFSSNSGIAGWGYIRWDGNLITVGDPTYNLPPLTGKDLTEGGLNSYILVSALGDLSGGHLTVALTDLGGNTFSISKVISDTVLTDYIFPFTSFTGVDPTQITKIEMGVNGAGGLRTAAPANFDASIHTILIPSNAVPEPGTLILGGLGLIGIGLLRRRRA